MPPAKKTTTSAAVSATNKTADNSNLELNKLVHKMISVEQDFLDNVKHFEQFKSDAIFSLDAELNDRKRKLSDLEESYQAEQKRRRIDIENEILKDKFEAAKKFLDQHNFVPIEKEKLAGLETAKNAAEEEARKAVEKEKEKSKRAVTEATKAQNLQHKAEIAQIEACVKQQDVQIAYLSNLLERKEKDVAAQIQLTKDVAEASRAGAIQQSFGSGSSK